MQIKLTADEKRYFQDFWKSIMPQHKVVDPNKWKFFDGEWVFVNGYGGIHFIPSDVSSWIVATHEGFIPCAKQDDLPYRTGRIMPKEIDEADIPEGLDLSLGTKKLKYSS